MKDDILSMLLRARLADFLIEGVVECAGQVQSLDNVGPIEAEIEKVSPMM